MAEHSKGSYRVVVPPGATIKIGTTIGQSGGDPPPSAPDGRGITFSGHDLKNESKTGDLIIEYEAYD